MEVRNSRPLELEILYGIGLTDVFSSGHEIEIEATGPGGTQDWSNLILDVPLQTTSTRLRLAAPSNLSNGAYEVRATLRGGSLAYEQEISADIEVTNWTGGSAAVFYGAEANLSGATSSSGGGCQIQNGEASPLSFLSLFLLFLCLLAFRFSKCLLL